MSREASTRGGARRRAPRRRRPLRRATLVLLATALTATAVYAGLRQLGTEGDPGRRPAGATPSATTPSTPSPTPLGDLDLSALPIARESFCSLLDEGDVETALDGPITDTKHYDNGDRVELSDGVTDVSHEYNCTYVGADRTQARAWVFAEPVTPRLGRSIVRESRRAKGCEPERSAPTFGTPSVTTLCRTRKPAQRVVTLRGLFGDAWLSCQLSTPGGGAPRETVRRGEQWCLKVATTLGARP